MGINITLFKNRLIGLAIVLLLPVTGFAGNQLDGNDSPYLAMHGKDPVAWEPWSEVVLGRAKRENKLIFVSIGYFSCHWCHVMQRESFQNTDIAKQLNEHFLSVKVDRELNPDLDAFLIDFVTRTRGSAGWPLNVFLTPDGYPLVGFTYLPADRFLLLLQELQQQWQQDPGYFKQAAARAIQAMKGQAPESEPSLTVDLARQYEKTYQSQALDMADVLSGGFGEQSKFPMVPHMESLLSIYQSHPDKDVEKFITLTLDNMATQGMRDHLGGGFFRYTVDPGWQTPHFEKMLYDNALLAKLYLRAARIFQRPDYEKVGRDTLDFMVSKMSGSNGAMITSFSAIDGANVEGGYYLWNEETLKRLLTPDELSVVNILWGMQGHEELEAGHLPRLKGVMADVVNTLHISSKKAEEILLSAREKLLNARASRALPVDDKYIASLNGLALSAFIEGARLEDSQKYFKAAKGIHNYLVTELWNGKRLFRAKGKSGEIGQAGLEDYAFVAQALLDWAELTAKGKLAESKDFSLVTQLVIDAWQRFYDKTGWRLSDQTLLPGKYGVPMLEEGPLPSPSAVLLNTSIFIGRYVQNEPLLSKVRDTLKAGHTQLNDVAFNYPSQISVLVRYLSEH